MTETEAQAVVVTSPGGPEVLKLRHRAVRAPEADEVLLMQEAVGLNYHDVYVRSGSYRTMAYPGVPGIEAAGIVQAVGTSVTEFRPGDRVAYIAPEYGAYTDWRVIAARRLVSVPAGVSAVAAAATLLKGVTAHMLLTRMKAFRAGDTILVHAAAGGVGQLLVQMARDFSLRVLGVVGDLRKAELAGSLGCAMVAVRTTGDVLTMVRDATDGKGVAAVFDGIGAATRDVSIAALAPFGHYCLFGQVTGPPAPIEFGMLSQRSLSCSRPIVFHHIEDFRSLRASATALFDGLSSGSIRMQDPTSFQLGEASAAHARLESGETSGSIVLIPS